MTKIQKTSGIKQVINQFAKIHTLVSCRSLPAFKEIANHICIKCKLYSKTNAAIRRISKAKFEVQQPIGIIDLKDLFVFRFMNSREREITELICTAINARVSNSEYKPLTECVCVALESSEAKLSIMWLMTVEVLAIAGGLFVLADNIRNVTVSKLLKKYEKKKRIQFFGVRRLFAIYFCAGEYDKALDVLERIGTTVRSTDESYRTRYTIINYEINSKTQTQITPLTDADKKFNDIIKGKSIAILGPSSNDEHIGDTIKDFDLIVRMTYRGVEYLSKDERCYGVDISYYSGLALYHISQMGDKRFFDDLKMAVFKHIDYDFQHRLVQEGWGRKKSGMADYFMFQGGENLLQAILVDLLHFSPGRIKLFNLNLFLSKNRYSSGYKIPGTVQSRGSLWGSFAIHNMISHYEFTKSLYDAGYFEADDQLAEVLSLGTAEYLRQMEMLD